MLKLAGKYFVPDYHENLGKRTVVRVSNTHLPAVLRKEEGYLLSVGETNVPHGYALYVLVGENQSLVDQLKHVPVVVLPQECGYELFPLTRTVYATHLASYSAGLQ